MDIESVLTQVNQLRSGLNDIVASLSSKTNPGNSSSALTKTIDAINDRGNEQCPVNSKTFTSCVGKSDKIKMELKQKFAPYGEATSGKSTTELFQKIRNFSQERTQIRGTPKRGQQKKDPIFSKRIVFLGDPSEVNVPNSQRLMELGEKDVKEDVVFSTRYSSAEEFYLKVTTCFRDMSDYRYEHLEVKWKLGYVRGRGMQVISFFKENPEPLKLIALKISCLYAKPSVAIVPMIHAEVSRDDSWDFDRNSVTDSTGVGGPDESYVEVFEVDSEDDEVLIMDASSKDLATFKLMLRTKKPGYQVIEVPDICESRIILEMELPKFLNEVDLVMKPKIRLTDSETTDPERTLRAYIWILLKQLLLGNMYKGVPIFEGEKNRLLPVRDACLLKDGVFKMIGRLTAFSILNADIGLFGISKVVVKYIFSDVGVSSNDIDVDDVPCVLHKNAITLLESLETSEDPDLQAVVKDTRKILLDAGWTYSINMNNYMEAVNYLKMYAVVQVRRNQLDDIREGFITTDVGQWLSANPQATDSYFKPASCITLPVSEIITAFGKIDVVLVDSFSHLCKFLQSISADEEQLLRFVYKMTGHDTIGNKKLTLVAEPDIQLFKTLARHGELLIIPDLSEDDFFYHMKILLQK